MIFLATAKIFHHLCHWCIENLKWRPKQDFEQKQLFYLNALKLHLKYNLSEFETSGGGTYGALAKSNIRIKTNDVPMRHIQKLMTAKVAFFRKVH